MKILAKDIRVVPVGDIQLNENNRNSHPQDQIDHLVKQFSYQGFRSPLIVSNRSGKLVCGHGRYLAAKQSGMTELPVIYQDFDSDEAEYAFGIAENSTQSWSALDIGEIHSDALELGPDFDLDMLGIKDFSLVSEQTIPQCDEDEIPEHVEPRTKPGDIYQLGKHRVMCGDSTVISEVDLLMNGQKADITFTSPPYNVGKTPNGNEKKYIDDIDNKDEKDYTDFLCDFTTNALLQSSFVFVNIQSLAGNKCALIEYLAGTKAFYADTIIWDKLTAEPAMAKNVLNSRFEYIHVFSKRANRVIGTKEFRGTQENIFQLGSRKDKEYSKEHKATYPVAFAQHFVENFSTDSVLDPFGGTGTTLIACENVGRTCYTMELSPAYTDIIVSRWEKFTGNKAQLLGSS